MAQHGGITDETFIKAYLKAKVADMGVDCITDVNVEIKNLLSSITPANKAHCTVLWFDNRENEPKWAALNKEMFRVFPRDGDEGTGLTFIHNNTSDRRGEPLYQGFTMNASIGILAGKIRQNDKDFAAQVMTDLRAQAK